MAIETKRFPLRVLLSITTSRLLTKPRGESDNGIGDVYDILGWMTNDPPMTHQIPRFCEECRPWLLRWFPELAHASTEAALGELDLLLPVHPEAAVEAWFMHLQRGMPGVFQDEYDVPRIPRDDHTVKNPYDELVEMQGTDEKIILVKKP